MRLWRPVNQAELVKIVQSGYRAFPPRFDWQPIFYPVCNLHYAQRIARLWNTAGDNCGFVCQFEVDDAYLSGFEQHQVGDQTCIEYWIPAVDLPEFNRHIQGRIEVIDAFDSPSDAEGEPDRTGGGCA